MMFGLSRRAEKPARFPSGSCQKLSLPEPKVGPSNSKIPSNSDHRYAGPTSGFDHFTFSSCWHRVLLDRAAISSQHATEASPSFVCRPCASSAEEHMKSYQSGNRPSSPTRVWPQMTKKFTSGTGRYSHAGRGK